MCKTPIKVKYFIKNRILKNLKEENIINKKLHMVFDELYHILFYSYTRVDNLV